MNAIRQELLEEAKVHDFIHISECFAFHKYFNAQVFRIPTGYQFTRLFNLHAVNTKINVPTIEKSRFCFLIDYLASHYFTLSKQFIRNHTSYEHPEFDYTPYRREWITIMLEMADISLEHFKKHYRDAVNSETKKNTELRTNLRTCKEMIKRMKA